MNQSAFSPEYRGSFKRARTLLFRAYSRYITRQAVTGLSGHGTSDWGILAHCTYLARLHMTISNWSGDPPGPIRNCLFSRFVPSFHSQVLLNASTLRETIPKQRASRRTTADLSQFPTRQTRILRR